MIKNLLGDDGPDDEEPSNSSSSGSDPGFNNLAGGAPDADETEKAEPFIISNAPPESIDETVRRSGLAWSAGIAFFASVVFMLVIGWMADLLFGSQPWGIVAGIVVGSLIGFVQFFRITSQIFKS